jgi:hypothetical protein
LLLEYRKLQRGGVRLFNIHYWSDVLPTLVKRDEPFVVHYGMGKTMIVEKCH